VKALQLWTLDLTDDSAIVAPKLQVIENTDATGEKAPRKSKGWSAGMSPCQLLDGSGQISTSSTQPLLPHGGEIGYWVFHEYAD
jgi:hypothetical protein